MFTRGAVGLALLAASPVVVGAEASAQQRIVSEPPPGFEDLDSELTTLFDVYLDGARLGAFQGTLSQGIFEFENPQRVVDVLPVTILPDETLGLIGAPLSANERFACGFGRTVNCGSMPPGQAGIIVNAATFRIDLFLPRDYRTSEEQVIRYLPDPEPGLGFIQSIYGSASATDSSAAGGIRYGLNFNTTVGFERNSLVSLIQLRDDEGPRANRFFAQRIFNNFRIRGGLAEAPGSSIFQTYRYYGAEIGNEVSGRIDALESRTQLDLILPQRATVEIYRGGLLVSAREYDPGFVILDTSDLPQGTYPIRIVARDGAEILLEEERTYSSTQGLPPPDRSIFAFRAGVLAGDGFSIFADNSMFPEVSDQAVVEGRVRRRMGQAWALGGYAAAVGERGYVGVDATVSVSGHLLDAGAGTDSDGGYTFTGTMNGPLLGGVYSVSSLWTENTGDISALTLDPQDFNIFGRERAQIFAGYSRQVFGGNLSFSSSFTRFGADADWRERYSVSYSRPLTLFNAPAVFSVNASTSDFEDRIIARLSFTGRIDSRSNWRASAGIDASDRRSAGTQVDPIGEISYDRVDQVGVSQLQSQVGLRSDRDRHQAYAAVLAATPRGRVDATLSAQQSRRGGAGVRTSMTMNGTTGFIFAPGYARFGVPEAGDSAIVARLDLSGVTPFTEDELRQLGTMDEAPPERGAESAAPMARPSGVADAGGFSMGPYGRHPHSVTLGRYEVTVNGRPVGQIDENETLPLPVPSLQEYQVGLRPIGAPPYDVDLSPRAVALFPGNVVILDWEAVEVFTVFGRLTGPDGQPLGNARLQSGSDVTLTTDEGYFTITLERGQPVAVRLRGQDICRVDMSASIPEGDRAPFHRVGSIVCGQAGGG